MDLGLKLRERASAPWEVEGLAPKGSGERVWSAAFPCLVCECAKGHMEQGLTSGAEGSTLNMHKSSLVTYLQLSLYIGADVYQSQ